MTAQKLIIFGNGKIAAVLSEYFRSEDEFEIVAFTCEARFIIGREHQGLPIVPFDEVVHYFPPDRHLMHIAVGYHQLNRLRERLFFEAKALGYHLASFVCVRSWPGKSIACGENCFIADGVSVEPGASIGNNVALWSNSVVGHHAVIHDHCWLAAGTVVGGGSIVEQRCFAALNVTIGNDVTVGADSFLGARALLTKSHPPKSVLVERDTERFRLDSEQFLRISKIR